MGGGLNNAGSATIPVYFNNGQPVACTYQLNKTVPSNAKFTDTTYSVATTSANGLMSAADKSKLDGLSGGWGIGSVTEVQSESIVASADTRSYYVTGNKPCIDITISGPSKTDLTVSLSLTITELTYLTLNVNLNCYYYGSKFYLNVNGVRFITDESDSFGNTVSISNKTLLLLPIKGKNLVVQI